MEASVLRLLATWGCGFGMPKIHMQMKYRCCGPTYEKVASHRARKNSSLCAEQSTWACSVRSPYTVGRVLVGEVRVNGEQQE